MNESASCKKEQENMGLFQSKSTETQTNSWESFVAQEIQNALNSLNCSFDGKATINTIGTNMLQINHGNHYIIHLSIADYPSKQSGKICICLYENTQLGSKIHEVESAWCSPQEIMDKMPKYIQHIVDYIDNVKSETQST